MVEIRLKNYPAAEAAFQLAAAGSTTAELKAQALFFLAQLISNDPARRKAALNYAQAAYSRHPNPAQVKMFIDQLNNQNK
jgi:hypothetical protein